MTDKRRSYESRTHTTKADSLENLRDPTGFTQGRYDIPALRSDIDQEINRLAGEANRFRFRGHSTAYIERRSRFLVMVFLGRDDELGQEESYCYRQLTQRGNVEVFVLWGTPPATVEFIQVFRDNKEGLRQECDVDGLRCRASDWWATANKGCPHLPAAGKPHRRRVVLNPQEEPADGRIWAFTSMLKGCFGTLSPSDIDAGCIVYGRLFLIEAKRDNVDLDTATKIAMKSLVASETGAGIVVWVDEEKNPTKMQVWDANNPQGSKIIDATGGGFLSQAARLMDELAELQKRKDVEEKPVAEMKTVVSVTGKVIRNSGLSILINDCCLPPAVVDGATGPVYAWEDDLYGAYLRCCDEIDEIPMKKDSFAKALGERGYTVETVNGKRRWQGIGLTGKRPRKEFTVGGN